MHIFNNGHTYVFLLMISYVNHQLALKMLGAHLGDEGLKEMLIPTNAASYRKSYMTTASDC